MIKCGLQRITLQFIMYYYGIITVALFFVAIWVLNSWKLVTIFYDQNKLYEQK